MVAATPRPSTNFTATVQRGCGFRVAGDSYLVFGLGTRPDDPPLENYLICPPKPLNTKSLGLSPIGVTVWVRNGVTHLVDWVGSNFYPNVADFLEEARRFGVSRKIPRTVLVDIAKNHPKLSHQSKLVLVHSKGFIHNAQEYFAHRTAADYWCPRQVLEHLDVTNPPTMCASLWHEDLVGGEPFDLANPRLVTVEQPSYSHVGMRRPDNVTPRYSPSFIAAFPISAIEIPEDVLSNKHLMTRDLAKAASRVKVQVTQQ